MIWFFADDHYDVSPGKHVFESLPDDLKKRISFHENDWAPLEAGEWEKNCDLLILNMIAGTCNQPMPGAGAEKAVRAYCERGGNILLLHGSSAAFWGWDWWRPIVGERWVRAGDPDGVEPSTHPHDVCTVRPAKTRHPLVGKLKEFSLPVDEIYIDLEQTSPVMILMTADVQGKTYPQACETISPWGGKILSFIPGHVPECTTNPGLVANVEAMIRYLL